MWLKIILNNKEKMELMNLNNAIRIYPVFNKFGGCCFSKIRFDFSNYNLEIGYETVYSCEKEFNRLSDEISKALSGGKNLVVFETNYNYYGGEKQ